MTRRGGTRIPLTEEERAESWFAWRSGLFDEGRRTCRQGHDWETFKTLHTVKGRTSYRCGECWRAAYRRRYAFKIVARRSA